MKAHKHTFFILVALFCFSAKAKPPSEFYEMPKVVAVFERPYHTKKDLTFNAGWLPSDAFNKGYSLGASYTHSFNDYIAWEVANFNYVINSSTKLKDEMEDLNIDFESEGFDGVLDYIRMYVTSNLIYTPFYNKSLAFNETVVHGNTSLVVGGGIANFDRTGNRFLLTGGIMLRFFTRVDRSWKVDIRNNIYFEETLGPVNAMSIAIGYSMELSEQASN